MIARLIFLLGFTLIAFASANASTLPLAPTPIAMSAKELALLDDFFDRRHELLTGINSSLRYLQSDSAERAYRELEQKGISRARVIRSLLRFRTLLFSARSSLELRESVLREFTLYRSVGFDGHGTVKFTGYFQPSYPASRVRTSEYRYPLYRRPAGFSRWKYPHPTRVALEGYDGLGRKYSVLNGKELVWLKSRFHVYMVHVQGSALLEMRDGSTMSVGFDGGTEYPFAGINTQCSGSSKLSHAYLERFFEQQPDGLNRCMSRNNRFIFFREQNQPEPIGALGLPVIAEGSIATDKKEMPPGALALISTTIPTKVANGAFRLVKASRFVLDHDAGKAIKGPGRVDIFMGRGREGEQKANSVYAAGSLYYLLLNEARI